MIPISLNDTKKQTMLQRVQSRLSAFSDADGRYLVAVSGGPDSMGLLSLLVLDLGIDRDRIVACYVDHGLRTTTDNDIAVIRSFTEKYKIEFRTCRVEAGELAKQQRKSIEAVARELRYDALQGVALESGCSTILTGHTLDDSAETVLMRMMSGAPWYEWTGIPARRGNILRSFIDVYRCEVAEYLKDKGIHPALDETNFDLRFKRNALRQKLKNRTFWSQDFMADLVNSGAQLDLWLKGLRSIADRITNCESKQVFTDCKSLAIERILTYFTKIPFLPIEAAWADLSGDRDKRLSSKLRRQISDCVTGSANHAVIHLPDEFLMERRGDLVWIYADSSFELNRQVELGETLIEPLKCKLVLAVQTETRSKDHDSVLLDGQLTVKTLTLRNWQAGDRFKVRGRPTKKISDLLSQDKVTPAERSRLLVLADEDGPLVLLGKYVNERALPAEDCRSFLNVRWIPFNGE